MALYNFSLAAWNKLFFRGSLDLHSRASLTPRQTKPRFTVSVATSLDSLGRTTVDWWVCRPPALWYQTSARTRAWIMDTQFANCKIWRRSAMRWRVRGNIYGTPHTTPVYLLYRKSVWCPRSYRPFLVTNHQKVSFVAPKELCCNTDGGNYMVSRPLLVLAPIGRENERLWGKSRTEVETQYVVPLLWTPLRRTAKGILISVVSSFQG